MKERVTKQSEEKGNKNYEAINNKHGTPNSMVSLRSVLSVHFFYFV